MVGKICMVYLDANILFTTKLDQHLKHLCMVLERLLEAWIILRMNKCAFMVDKLVYLGYIISKRTLSTDSKKTKAIDGNY